MILKMKTNYQEMFEFDKDFNCEILDNIDFIRLRTNMRVYIPIYMSNIEKGAPSESVISTKGKSIFVSEVKPTTTSITLKTQNYLTVKKLNNGQIISYVKSLSDKDGKKYVTSKGTTVKGRFLNNKLSQLYAEVLLSDGKEITVKDS